MSYKVLMAYVDLDDGGDARMSLAAELAGRYHAALIGVAAWAPAPAISVDIAALESVREVADLRVMEDYLKSRGDKFRAVVGKAAGTVEWRSALALPTEFVVQEVRAADLVIIGGSRHPVLRDPYSSVDPGAVLLRAGRPMLLVPAGITSLAGKRIAVAWKDTREARRAIVDALPFLQMRKPSPSSNSANRARRRARAITSRMSCNFCSTMMSTALTNGSGRSTGR